MSRNIHPWMRASIAALSAMRRSSDADTSYMGGAPAAKTGEQLCSPRGIMLVDVGRPRFLALRRASSAAGKLRAHSLDVFPEEISEGAHVRHGFHVLANHQPEFGIEPQCGCGEEHFALVPAGWLERAARSACAVGVSQSRPSPERRQQICSAYSHRVTFRLYSSHSA